MTAHFRRAVPVDAPALLTVRAATLENPFSIEALAAVGVTGESVARGLEAGTLAGWVSEAEPGTVAGFCLADVPAGELWVLAVLPTYERRGFGRELLARTEQLLWQGRAYIPQLGCGPRQIRACALVKFTLPRGGRTRRCGRADFSCASNGPNQMQLTHSTLCGRSVKAQSKLVICAPVVCSWRLPARQPLRRRRSC